MTARQRLQKQTFSHNISCRKCRETLTRHDAQTGKIIKIQDELLHVSCLQCAKCQRPLGTTPCYPMSLIGPFRCSDCHREATAPKCHGCKKPTFERCVSAFAVYWHDACFKCKGCNRQFKNKEYIVHEGCGYDEDCYYRLVEGIETPARKQIRE